MEIRTDIGAALCPTYTLIANSERLTAFQKCPMGMKLKARFGVLKNPRGTLTCMWAFRVLEE